MFPSEPLNLLVWLLVFLIVIAVLLRILGVAIL